MKKRFVLLAAVFLLMGALPFLSLADRNEIVEESQPSEQSKLTSKPERAQETYFVILNQADGKVVKMEEKEFLYGALAYEMPPYFETEALKAQAVATYTHFARRRQNELESPDPKLKGAHFSADLSKGQYYLSESQRRQKWGGSYEEYMQKIRTVCDSVYGQVLTDAQGNLIDAAYHAISGGATENAKDVFGTDLPYLQAVASPGDMYAPDYLTDISFSASEFICRLKTINSKLQVSSTPSQDIKKIDRTPSGTVRTIQIGNQTFTGAQIRTAFSLRSANFEIEAEDDTFTFYVRGYGHGVGLSQYGALSMAQDGADYREILYHYYTGTTLKKR